MSPSNTFPSEQPAAASPVEPATDDQVAPAAGVPAAANVSPAAGVPLAAVVAPNTAVSYSCAVSELC